MMWKFQFSTASPKVVAVKILKVPACTVKERRIWYTVRFPNTLDQYKLYIFPRMPTCSLHGIFSSTVIAHFLCLLCVLHQFISTL
jgi:hypothetical protein